jgi:hypothetical protein
LQVATRIVEMTFGNRYHPIWTLTAATSLIGLAMVLLPIGISLVRFAVIAYRTGNGLFDRTWNQAARRVRAIALRDTHRVAPTRPAGWLRPWRRR